MENFFKHEQESVTNKKPNFLQEPILANGLLVDYDSIKRLERDAWLSTNFIDFLIKYGFEGCKENNFIVPTSASDALLTVLCRLSDSKKPDEMEKVKRIQKKYQFFSLKNSHLVLVNCTDSHYFVISLKFDPTNLTDNVFPEVVIYDSLRISDRRKKLKKPPNTIATKFLKKLQFFIARYVLHDTDIEKMLLSNDDYILKNLNYMDCPHQENGHDCRTFCICNCITCCK